MEIIIERSDISKYTQEGDIYYRISSRDTSYIEIVKPQNIKRKYNIFGIGILIEGYIFSIRRFEIYSSGRCHVIIYSTHVKTRKQTRHIYYTSNSEGGIWRYCTRRRSDGGYEKGYNYITSTFININLQMFLFKFIDYFEITDRTKDEINCTFIDDSSNRLIKDRIQNGRYLHKNPFFVLLDFFNSGTIFEKYNESYIKLLELSIKITNILIKKIQDSDDIKIVPSQWSYDLVTQFIQILPYKIMPSVGMGREEFIKKLYKCIQNFFLKHIKIQKGTKKFIGNHTCNIKDVGTITFSIFGASASALYFDSTDKEKTDELVIYYQTYEFRGKKYKALLSIDTLDSKILNNGLNDKYISCGILIYKISDYIVQISMTRTRGDDPYVYGFIGDIVNFEELP